MTPQMANGLTHMAFCPSGSERPGDCGLTGSQGTWPSGSDGHLGHWDGHLTMSALIWPPAIVSPRKHAHIPREGLFGILSLTFRPLLTQKDRRPSPPPRVPPQKGTTP